MLAFYLPQFHPIPENDLWWGKGFTEWTNVVRAKPLFRGHYQPQLPADLGFYDLRLAEARNAQAALARQHGVHGFCYYHYWFEGQRLLNRPLDEVLSSGEPDFPFCLCWANESWTRRWDGLHNEVLRAQTYGGEKDDCAHIDWLMRVFADRRYIRVNGMPLFLIYRARELPDIRQTISVWRQKVLEAGFPGLYLCSVDSSWARNWNPTPSGFNAAVEFQPAFTLIRPGLADILATGKVNWLLRGKHQRHTIVLYKHFVDAMLQRNYPEYKMFRCVTPGFDNTPRRTGLPVSMLHTTNPEDFGRWLTAAVSWTRTHLQGEEQVVFVNAWNEWAEGNHLEPDQRFGHAFLQEIPKALGA